MRSSEMATDPGNHVLDPTCGSGTTATVAEQWGRRWITTGTSRPFDKLSSGRIAVKVINHLGGEVMKVFGV
jgi:adenine-specific DNA-methyltransferase